VVSFRQGAKPIYVKVPAGEYVFSVDAADLPSCSTVSAVSGETVSVQAGQTIAFTTATPFDGHMFDLNAGEPLVAYVEDGIVYSNWDAQSGGEQIQFPHPIYGTQTFTFTSGECQVNMTFAPVGFAGSANIVAEGVVTDAESWTATGECSFDFDYMEWHVDGDVYQGETVSVTLSPGQHEILLDAYGPDGSAHDSVTVTSIHETSVEELEPPRVSNGQVAYGRSARYELIDSAGRVVRRGTTNGNGSLEISSGLYFVRIDGVTYKIAVR
jgi:hypothetical protein